MLDAARRQHVVLAAIARRAFDLRTDFKVGDHFVWQPGEAGASDGRAVVTRLLTDRDEGYSREIEDYVSMSIEARASSGEHAGALITLIVRMDEQTRLDGRIVTVSLEKF